MFDQYYVSVNGGSLLNVTEQIERLKASHAELLAACETVDEW